MHTHWIHRANSPELLIFFAGWGMDPAPFGFLEAGNLDVLMCCDYTEAHMPADFPQLLDAYRHVDLAAWSLGVAVANALCGGLRNRFRDVIALNGSVTPIHPEYGIPPAIFDGTLANLNADGLRRFRRRACHGREALERFDATLPQRDLASLTAELVALRDRFSGVVARHHIYTRALVGNQDMIFPACNQLKAWELMGVPCVTVDAPHFPFYRWTTWRQLTCLQ